MSSQDQISFPLIFEQQRHNIREQFAKKTCCWDSCFLCKKNPSFDSKRQDLLACTFPVQFRFAEWRLKIQETEVGMDGESEDRGRTHRV